MTWLQARRDKVGLSRLPLRVLLLQLTQRFWSLLPADTTASDAVAAFAALATTAAFVDFAVDAVHNHLDCIALSSDVNGLVIGDSCGRKRHQNSVLASLPAGATVS